MGGVVTGEYTFLDPYDPRVGVLVCPDIDHHIDRFNAGFFVQVTFTISKLMSQGSDIIFHVFRTSALHSSKHFAPTAWKMQHKHAKIILNPPMREVLAWHYKHCLILSWGGLDLISFSRNFSPPTVRWLLCLRIWRIPNRNYSLHRRRMIIVVLTDLAYCNIIV